MTTPDTESVEEGRKKIAQKIVDFGALLDVGQDEKASDIFIEIINDYEELISSRDTYWKERVRKEVEGMKITSDPQSVQVNAHIATWEQGYNHAISEVLELDNLK